MQFTACYTKLEEGYGYMGQLLEWPNVITDGKDLEECRDSLIEVAAEMAEIYEEDGLEIPNVSLMVEPLDVPIKEQRKACTSTCRLNAETLSDISRSMDFFSSAKEQNTAFTATGKELIFP